VTFLADSKNNLLNIYG